MRQRKSAEYAGSTERFIPCGDAGAAEAERLAFSAEKGFRLSGFASSGSGKITAEPSEDFRAVRITGNVPYTVLRGALLRGLRGNLPDGFSVFLLNERQYADACSYYAFRTQSPDPDAGKGPDRSGICRTEEYYSGQTVRCRYTELLSAAEKDGDGRPRRLLGLSPDGPGDGRRRPKPGCGRKIMGSFFVFPEPEYGGGALKVLGEYTGTPAVPAEYGDTLLL